MKQVGDNFECVAYGKIQEGRIEEFDRVVEGCVYLSGIKNESGSPIDSYLTDMKAQVSRVEEFKIEQELQEVRVLTKNNIWESIVIITSILAISFVILFSWSGI